MSDDGCVIRAGLAPSCVARQEPSVVWALITAWVVDVGLLAGPPLVAGCVRVSVLASVAGEKAMSAVGWAFMAGRIASAFRGVSGGSWHPGPGRWLTRRWVGIQWPSLPYTRICLTLPARNHMLTVVAGPRRSWYRADVVACIRLTIGALAGSVGVGASRAVGERMCRLVVVWVR